MLVVALEIIYENSTCSLIELMQISIEIIGLLENGNQVNKGSGKSDELDDILIFNKDVPTGPAISEGGT